MNINRSLRTGGAVVVIALLVAASSHAWIVTHENKLTFSRPVSLPGVVLPAGPYSFDIATSSSTLNLVVVRDHTRKVLYTGFTNLVQRPRTLPANAMITFGEALPTEPPPIAVWYPIGESYGHEFLYRR